MIICARSHSIVSVLIAAPAASIILLTIVSMCLPSVLTAMQSYVFQSFPQPPTKGKRKIVGNTAQSQVKKKPANM